MVLTADIEANGLLEYADTIWTIQVKPIGEENWKYSYRWDEGDIYSCLMRLANADVIVGHNWIGYDDLLLSKLYNFNPKGKILDTLVLSRLLWPDRPKGHSLEEWGKRLGFGKGDFQDFGEFSEDMVGYCKRDVRLTEKIMIYLLTEEVNGSPELEITEQVRALVR